ncbi:MAG: hypothetical protein ACREIT_09245, partial [Tepidisphaeraceae bacterium]
SPLASSPPASTVHWIVLVDSSGSMLARWESATGALTGLLPHLPPADTLSAGNFAAGVRWWVERVNVSEARAMALPPRDVLPHGPTNLAAALRAVAGAERGNGPTELLLLTDAEAKLDDVDALVTSLAEKKVRIHLLGVAPIAADNPVRRVVAGTGGVLLEQTDPRHWAESFGQLMRQAMPQRLSNNPIEVQFEARLGTLAARPVVPWNRTWLKPGSDKLASAQAPHGPAPMAAAWSVGAGQVAAAAFGANVAETTALAELVAAPPRDPRLKVTWESGPQLRVTLDAVDEQRYLNGLAATLEIMAQDTSVTPTLPATQPVPQTAPGRYELWTSAPRAPSFAALRVGGRVVARAAVAGRYAPEFDAIGTDYVALRELARRSGGEVIEPTRTSPINFRWPPRRVALTSYLAITGASLVAAALAWWRCRG